MGSWRAVLQQPRGRVLAAALGIVALACGVWSVGHYLGPSPAAAASSRGLFICAQTGKPFNLTISPGMSLPVHSPHSGMNSGYPAELCYWTSDGQIRAEPVPVLLNSYLGKRDPTFCPDCGRLVRARNPQPVPGSPPPTRQQYRPMED